MERWRAGTEAARAQHVGERRRLIRYGTRPRNVVELFLPLRTAPAPTILFLHGGWWQEGSIDVASFPASLFTDAGFGWGSIGYTLAPEATLGEIVVEVEQALAALVRHAGDRVDASRLILAGHSAGAHLAAAHAVRVDRGEAQAPVAGLVLLSGAYDLRPVQESYVNDLVGMSPEDATSLSPLLQARPSGIPMLIGVGTAETEEFVRNSRSLHREWSDDRARTDLVEVQRRDHFDLLDEFASVEGVLAQRAFSLLDAARA